jgi:hypothetical protein
MSELVMLFALSIVAAILFNFGAPRFAQSSIGQRFVGSYFKVTLGTAIVFFAVIYVASLLVSVADGRIGLPTTRNPLP